MAKDGSMSLPLAIKKYLSLPGETSSDLMRQIRDLTEPGNRGHANGSSVSSGGRVGYRASRCLSW